MKDLKTVNIKGKPYVLVNERIKAFRELYPKYSLESEIVSLEGNQAIIKAVIKDENGRIVATGIAHEVKGDGFINKTSHIENCETSAWGRALGCLGIGIDTSIASAEEVENAIAQQNKFKTKNGKINDWHVQNELNKNTNKMPSKEEQEQDLGLF